MEITSNSNQQDQQTTEQLKQWLTQIHHDNAILFTILYRSQIFKLKTGPTVFLKVLLYKDIQRKETNTSIHEYRVILLINEALLILNDIHQYPIMISIHQPIIFHWKDEEKMKRNDGCWNINPFIEFYLIDSRTKIQIINNQHLIRSMSLHIDQYSVDEVNEKLEATLLLSLLRPKSMIMKEQCAQSEFDVTGKINRINKYGGLFITEVKITVSMIDIQRLPTLDTNETNISQRVSVTSKQILVTVPHSQYHLKQLFGKNSLKIGDIIGFQRVLPVYLWGKLKSFACTARTSIFTRSVDERFDQSKSEVVPFSIPSIVRNSCHLYCAWRVEILEILQNQLQINISSINFEDLFSFCEDAVKSDFVIKNALCVKDRAVYLEFSSKHYAALIAVNAGHDNDWLSKQLPMMMSIQSLQNKLLQLLKSDSWYKKITERKFWLPLLDSACILVNHTICEVLKDKVQQDENCNGQGVPVVVFGELSRIRACHQRNNHRKFTLFATISDPKIETSTVELIVRSCSSNWVSNLMEYNSKKSYSLTFFLRFATVLIKCWNGSVLPAQYTIIVSDESQVYSNVAISQVPSALLTGKRCDSIFEAGMDVEIDKCRSVRQILSAPTGRNEVFINAVVGIVVRIANLSDPFLKCSDIVDPCKKRKLSELQSSDAMCSITIQDEEWSDKIVVYIPSSKARPLFIGNICLLRSFVLCLSKSGVPYLRAHVSDYAEASINTIGIVSINRLKRQCLLSCDPVLSQLSRLPRFLDCHFGDDSQMAPSITISELLQMSGWQDNNLFATSPSLPRCLWTLCGRISFIQRFHISLRCSVCQSVAKKEENLLSGGNKHFQMICPRCKSSLHLQPLWELGVAFDDGTAECNVQVEGNSSSSSSIFRLFKSRYDRTGSIQKDIIALVEYHCKRSGAVTYNPLQLFRNNATTAASSSEFIETEDCYPENTIFDFANSEVLGSLVSNIDLLKNQASIDPVEALRSYSTSCDYGQEVSFICKVDASMTNFKRYTRNIKLQETNWSRKHSNSNLSLPTQGVGKIHLEAYHIIFPDHDSIIRDGWKKLDLIRAMD